MLNREVVKEFLNSELKEVSIKLPKDIAEQELTEVFCRHIEDDYYEWLKDNFKSFFNYGNPDWNWIKERIEHYSKNETIEPSQIKL